MTTTPSPPSDYTPLLRSLMAGVGISHFTDLSRRAAVSAWQIRQLRLGRANHLRAEGLYRVSQVLQISLEDLLHRFSPLPSPQSATEEHVATDALRDEYRRLEAQLMQQRELLWQEFQQTSLQALESWLIQFPTAAYAAQHNPQVPASRLLPLMRPVEQLVQTWDVEAIAPVGAEVPYDPLHHQLMEGHAQPGDLVRIRYVGYRQGDRLLHRAKVSPVPS